MGFEIVVPSRIDGVKPGMAGLAKTGSIRLARADLTVIGVTDKVVVLADTTSKRVAFRKPRDREPSFVVAWAKKGVSADIKIGAALKTLGIDPAKVAGRYDVARKEDLQIVQF